MKKNLTYREMAEIPSQPATEADSSEFAGSIAMTGLDESELAEFEELRIKHIGEVSQEDWCRFNDLTAKIINRLSGQ